MAQPLISICIPCYNKPHFVVRCLQSILKQDYKQVEVILSDDSSDEATEIAILPFRKLIEIRYYRNISPLKTPQNWNAALDKANGQLITLLHQDDWYHADNALSTYVTSFIDPSVDFVFCKNTAINDKQETFVLQAMPHLLKNLYSKPNHLILAQVIGPPSNTILRKSVSVRYDERLIWFVDVDYYIRLLKAGYKYRYVPAHLVSIGLHKDQTTEYVRNNEHIIIRENMIVVNKLEKEAFKDIRIYDYYWRFLRNYKIRKIEDVVNTGVRLSEIPDVIKKMLAFQTIHPMSLLTYGVYSKIIMTVSYLLK